METLMKGLIRSASAPTVAIATDKDTQGAEVNKMPPPRRSSRRSSVGSSLLLRKDLGGAGLRVRKVATLVDASSSSLSSSTTSAESSSRHSTSASTTDREPAAVAASPKESRSPPRESSSSCLSSESQQQRPPRSLSGRGCLLVRTQQESLRRMYGGSGTKLETMSSASSSSGVNVEKREPAASSTSVEEGRQSHSNTRAYRGADEELEEAIPLRSLTTRLPSMMDSLPKKSVSFSHLTVHSHPLILGDNPSACSGPPLALGWDAFESVTLLIDAYEFGRPGPPRRHTELQVPGKIRSEWLRLAGYTGMEIASAERECRRVQRRRIASAAGAPGCHHLPSAIPGHHPTGSPYNPCGSANQFLKQGLAKLLTKRKVTTRRGMGTEEQALDGAAGGRGV